MPTYFSRSRIFDFNAKPYNLLGITGLLLIIFSFVPTNVNSKIVDVNIYDTYFVIAPNHIMALFGIVMMFLRSIYWVSSDILFSKILTWIHVTFTICSGLTFLFLTYRISAIREYYANNQDTPLFDWVMLGMIMVASFMIAQLIFVLNIIFGGIRAILAKNKAY